MPAPRKFRSANAYRQFARRIVRSHRYILDAESVGFLDTLYEQSLDRRRVLPASTRLWRAQVGNVEDASGAPAPLPPGRMKPPGDRGKEGRANPKGIPYLYLASEGTTAMAEVRPWIGSMVSLARFRTVRDLTIMNCFAARARRRGRHGIPPVEWDRAVWRDIDRAFARPVQAADDVAEYAPTQVIAEFFKVRGVDGIGYRSSLGSGFNVVLFDAATAELHSCQLYEARAVSFDFRAVAKGYVLRAGTSAYSARPPRTART